MDFDEYGFPSADTAFVEADASDALRRARSLVGTSEGRPEHDFYPTPPEATEALLSVEPFAGTVWEPACGDGAICKVFRAHGHDILATDLIDRGYGTGGLDFLTSDHRADNIVTNPPFRHAEAFVRHALARTTRKVAILGKLAFLEGARRREMFESTPLEAVWVFSRRLTMTRDGARIANSGMIAFAWFIWNHDHEGPPTLGWL